MSAPARAAREARQVMPSDGGKRRILYAEDQTSTRIVTTALIERLGYDVVAVEDGELALEQAKTSQFDVILLDIEMPVMDGVTAARCIRRDVPSAKDTPILALSAFLADSTEHSIWRDAFDSALPKPANGNELGKALRNALKPKPFAAENATPLLAWQSFSSGLPPGTRRLLARTVAEEMRHIILALASCLLAADHAGKTACEDRLCALAQSFGADAICSSIGKADPQALLKAVAAWESQPAK